ncbi:MAG: helix-turn-helix transcriptional regulator [Methylococcaceae bacterium]|nr:helix-turn-helix transcriptional regulator [Methylococcaceae bacterium]
MPMSLRIYRPSLLLQPYVTAIWDYRNLLAGDNLALSILPDTATYLCFLYEDSLTTVHGRRRYTTRSGLAGFQSFRSDLAGAGSISGVSARLSPWGLSVFRRGIARDCAERRVDCRDIFPPYTIERIEDDLARLVSSEDRVGYVDRFLRSLLDHGAGDRLVQTACRALERSRGTCSIAGLARTLGLTERTLERRFHSQIGATPKKYARVVRLRKALLERRRQSNWADVACLAGYYDQSHMIRDFQELYGMSPDTLYPRLEFSSTIGFSGLLDLSESRSSAGWP